MTIKNTALRLLLFLQLLTISAQAEILRWPQLCTSGKLQVMNKSSQNVRAWIQKFNGAKRTESEVNLRAFSQNEISIQATHPEDRFTLMHFSDSQKIKAVLNCEKEKLKAEAYSYEGGVLTFIRSDLQENKIWLQNLFSGENEVLLEYFDRQDKWLGAEIIPLRSLEKKTFKTEILENNWHHINVSGKNRFSVFNLNLKGTSKPVRVQTQKSEVDLQAAYFVVGPREGLGDTFIAKISDPGLIARARELIVHPEYEKMLFAKIEKGHQGYNRNWSKIEKSFWSWSITEVTNFADIGSTACNGLPQQVEDDVDLWVQNPGRICFWNYRVKTELTAEQVAQENPE